jgi:hypothetical protein
MRSISNALPYNFRLSESWKDKIHIAEMLIRGRFDPAPNEHFKGMKQLLTAPAASIKMQLSML